MCCQLFAAACMAWRNSEALYEQVTNELQFGGSQPLALWSIRQPMEVCRAGSRRENRPPATLARGRSLRCNSSPSPRPRPSPSQHRSSVPRLSPRQRLPRTPGPPRPQLPNPRQRCARPPSEERWMSSMFEIMDQIKRPDGTHALAQLVHA